jgi:hypothetical protein
MFSSVPHSRTNGGVVNIIRVKFDIFVVVTENPEVLKYNNSLRKRWNQKYSGYDFTSQKSKYPKITRTAM